MTSIELIVNGAEAKAKVRGTLTGGMTEIPVAIRYDKSWNGLSKTLVCRSDAMWNSKFDTVKTIVNVEQKATVAHEVMIAGRRLFLGMEGRNAEGTLVVSTNWACCGKIEDGPDGNADLTVEPTAPVWAQIIAMIGSLEDLETEDRENLVTAINEALTTGGTGGKGEDGTDGRGIVSVERTDGNGAAGTVDTYTITYTDKTTSSFTVRHGANGSNGKDGADGTSGPQGEKGEDGLDGKSAYAYAREGGYTGTETEFAEKLAYDYKADIDNLFQNKADKTDVPDYWLSALETGADAIREAVENAGRNKSAFLFYSDAHWNYGSKETPVLLKYLYRHTPVNKVIFGGDIVNNEPTADTLDDRTVMEYLWDWRYALRELPHHSVVGNHDDGNATNGIFPENYIYAYLLAAEENEAIVPGDGFYYYIDDRCEKTRYLYLDTAYKGLGDAQTAFVTEALKTTPEGWHIVAVSHIWHEVDYTADPPGVGELSADAAALLKLFDSYNARSGDFADCGGWVEFCIGGHTHVDHDSISDGGIPVILVETDSQHVRSGLSCTAGTPTEASVNCIVADYDAHKIRIIRIGRGESREVEIENYVVSYTNVLPAALDTDGGIYNGVGYKADVRWSSSGQAESSSSGIYLTGWIPVGAGDTVYLKNITMDKNTTVTNECLVWFADELGSTSGNLNAANLTAYNSAEWNEDGYLTKFIIESTETRKFIRLQAAYIGSDSIVSINEPIS